MLNDNILQLKRGLIVKQQLENRLKELQTEYESGQKMMADLESKQANLRDTMLRISGAIQVLDELISTENARKMPDLAGQNSEIYSDQKTGMEIEVVEEGPV